MSISSKKITDTVCLIALCDIQNYIPDWIFTVNQRPGALALFQEKIGFFQFNSENVKKVSVKQHQVKMSWQSGRKCFLSGVCWVSRIMASKYLQMVFEYFDWRNTSIIVIFFRRKSKWWAFHFLLVRDGTWFQSEKLKLMFLIVTLVNSL